MKEETRAALNRKLAERTQELNLHDEESERLFIDEYTVTMGNYMEKYLDAFGDNDWDKLMELCEEISLDSILYGQTLFKIAYEQEEDDGADS